LVDEGNDKHTRNWRKLKHSLAATIDGTGPHDATVTALAQAVPYRWDRNFAGKFSEQSSNGGGW
jgi:hypothetical protein